MRALLCLGLRREGAGPSLAPRLLREGGAPLVGAALPPRGTMPRNLAERVTYLGQILPPGAYDAEVVEQPAGVEVPVIYPVALTQSEVPAWAQAELGRNRWRLP